MNLNFLTSSKDFDSAVVSKEEYFPKDYGWIEWGGGRRPVPPDTLVEVRFRDGGHEDVPYRASTYLWGHDTSSAGIVAYKVVDPK